MKPSYFCLILLLSPLLWSASCQVWVKDFERQIEIDSRPLTETSQLDMNIRFPSEDLRKKKVERISFRILDSAGELIGEMSKKIMDESSTQLSKQLNYQAKTGQRLIIQPILFRKAKELQLTPLTVVVSAP